MGATDYAVNILLNAKDNTKTGVKSAKGGLDGLAKAAKFAAGAFAAIKTAQAGLEFVKQGAQLIETKDRFIAFSGGSAQATKNLEIFRTATKGTVSDSESMVAVTKLMGMGLVSNAEQMGEVARIAVQLGDQTQDAGNRIMSFAQMLATGSSRRLYEYGLNVTNVEQRAKELLATHQGMAKDEAFKLAVLEEGRKQLQKLGDAGLSADDKLDRVDAAVKNVKDNLAMMAANLVDASGALDFLSERLPKLPATLEQLATMGKLFAQIPLVQTLQKVALVANPVVLILRGLWEVLKGIVWVGAQVVTFLGVWATKNDAVRLAMYKALPAEQQTNVELNKMRDAAANAATKTGELTRSIHAIPAKKTIDLSFIVRGAKNLQRLLGLQSGGIGSGLTLVGEGGPELVQLPAGSRVYSHEQTRNITNNFYQTVNTRATSGTVIQDYQMLRALVG